VPVTGTIKVTLPAVQTVAGTVNVGNLPAVQDVAGTVNVGNLPAVQGVSGTVSVGNVVTTKPAALGLFSLGINVGYGQADYKDPTFIVSPARDLEVYLRGSAFAPHGQIPSYELYFITNPTWIFIEVPLKFVRADVYSGMDLYQVDDSKPLFIPANTNVGVTLIRDPSFTGPMYGGLTLNGRYLN
jgi:hypothetical protein